jgi:hypothetical protein
MAERRRTGKSKSVQQRKIEDLIRAKLGFGTAIVAGMIKL